uniref:YggS family pyridoxal phosphate-dependent enzyme n=1 Tax=Alistipes sp. TaxID=1872444 RepID=UPI004056CB70
MQKESIQGRLTAIRATLPEGVTLIAVSKTHPVEALQEAYLGGERRFGESRPQELKAKAEVLPQDIEWHMIGHLQTNKVRMIMPYVTLIHSVDSPRLLLEIEKEAARIDRTVDILFELHVAQEESKTGWRVEEFEQWLATGAWQELSHVRFRGVMGIASNSEKEELVRADFRALRGWFERLKPHFGADFDTLSMGMSDDYPMAILEGSTMVRVGSKIFGYRNYSK